MFASTNLVIELGVLILIFLGWQFLAAEILGGLLLIAISTVPIRLTYPRSCSDAAREKVEHDAPPEEAVFIDDRNCSRRSNQPNGDGIVSGRGTGTRRV